MSAKVSMDVEEYLRTSFDGADCEYLDGEVVERNLGELPHDDVQGNLYHLLRGCVQNWEFGWYPRFAFRFIRAAIGSPTSRYGATIRAFDLNA